MIMYALHHSWLTKESCDKLDSWQARTLRRLLRIKASMISRISNEEVLSRAKCTPFSTMVRQNRLKYMGHVLRQDYTSTIYNVCFDSSKKVRTPNAKRRRKRPLDNWTRKTLQEVISIGGRLPLAKLRPSPRVVVATAGSLYAHKLAQDRTFWRRHVVRGTYAPARRPVGRVGAPLAGLPPPVDHGPPLGAG